MATVTKTIGTTGRDYSTVTLWEADLDDSGIYSSTDVAVGEGYADSTFAESVDINGGATIGLDHVVLSVAAGERHDGTAGTGVVNDPTGAYGFSGGSQNLAGVSIIEWWEVTGIDTNSNPYGIKTSSGAGDDWIVRNLIVHDISAPSQNWRSVVGIGGNSNFVDIYNCIIYDVHQNASGATNKAFGIRVWASALPYNLTVYDVTEDGGNGVGFESDYQAKATNVVSMDCDVDFDITTTTDVDYCCSSDATATGSNSLTSKSAANQFTSTTGGSEDFSVKDEDADIFLAGEDKGATGGVNIDIKGRDRDTYGGGWSIGADNGAWKTLTIGTTGRDYSTVTLWEADLDTAAYASGDEAIGELYADSTFGETWHINGGSTVGLGAITLTVASGERHDGTRGTGATFNPAAGVTGLEITANSTGCNVTVEWFEIDGSVNDTRRLIAINHSGSSPQNEQNLRNLLVYGTDYDSWIYGIFKVSWGKWACLNCQVFDIHCTGTVHQECYGIYSGAYSTSEVEIMNCTVQGIEHDSSNAGADLGGLFYNDTATCEIKNCVVTDIIDNGGLGGNYYHFSNDSPSSADVDYCATDDSTVPGGNSLKDLTVAEQYISTTPGSEDLGILDQGADIWHAGTDLGTSPSGVEVDTEGVNRDSLGYTWSIGAFQDEDAAAVGGSIPPMMDYYRRCRCA